MIDGSTTSGRQSVDAIVERLAGCPARPTCSTRMPVSTRRSRTRTRRRPAVAISGAISPRWRNAASVTSGSAKRPRASGRAGPACRSRATGGSPTCRSGSASIHQWRGRPAGPCRPGSPEPLVRSGTRCPPRCRCSGTRCSSIPSRRPALAQPDADTDRDRRAPGGAGDDRRDLRAVRILCIGRVAQRAADGLGIPATYVRHPAQGGAVRFRAGVAAFLDDRPPAAAPPSLNRP